MGLNSVLVIVVLTGASIGAVSISFLRRLSLRTGFLMVGPVPASAGMGIGISFIISGAAGYFLSAKQSDWLPGIFIASSLMLVFGLVDDRKELSVKAKFIVQFIAVSLLMSFGVRTRIVYIGEPLNILITFLWVIGITNAFNLLDIMDGLAAGTGFMVSLSFLIIALGAGDMSSAILASALLGAMSLFLLKNLPPAKVYMGNAGSHFVGFVLASVAMVISYAPMERKAALLSPLVILGLPIFDTVFVILMRVLRKKSPFRKSADHIALRLVSAGYSVKKALFVMLLLCVFFCSSGIIISRAANTLGLAVTAMALAVSLSLGFVMGRVGIDA